MTATNGFEQAAREKKALRIAELLEPAMRHFGIPPAEQAHHVLHLSGDAWREVTKTLGLKKIPSDECKAMVAEHFERAYREQRAIEKYEDALTGADEADAAGATERRP